MPKSRTSDMISNRPWPYHPSGLLCRISWVRIRIVPLVHDLRNEPQTSNPEPNVTVIPAPTDVVSCGGSRIVTNAQEGWSLLVGFAKVDQPSL